MTAIEDMIAAKVEQGLDAARYLAAHGIPLFTAEAAMKDGQWDPSGGHGGCGYWLPKGWQHSPADPGVADTWRVGMALCAVMGHGLDLLDVDPRHGGEATRAGLKAAGLWQRSYGVAATPSGGTHDFIASLGVSSRDAVADGLDVKAGVDGRGHGFAFLAPTVRTSKQTGELLPYHWLSLPDLAGLDDGDDTGAGIAEMVRSARSGTASSGFDTASPPFELPDRIPVGQRDQILFNYASSLRARGTKVSDAQRVMREAWKRCEQSAGNEFPIEGALQKIDQAWGYHYTPKDAGRDASSPGSRPSTPRSLGRPASCASARQPASWSPPRRPPRRSCRRSTLAR
jgi:hypothetical protein